MEHKLTWKVDSRGFATAYIGDESDPTFCSTGQVYPVAASREGEEVWKAESENANGDGISREFPTRTAALNWVEACTADLYPGDTITLANAADTGTKPKRTRKQRADKGKPRKADKPKAEPASDPVAAAQQHRAERDRLLAERAEIDAKFEALVSDADSKVLEIVDALDRVLGEP